MKWLQSFLMHPILNRFNVLYLFSGLAATAVVPVDNLGWAVLAGEAAYLIARGALDRSRIPAFNLRALHPKERQRYLRLWETAERVEDDLTANREVYGAMSASAKQVKRLLHSFLDLQILAMRIDKFVLSRRINYDAEIAAAQAQLARVGEGEKTLVASNLEVLKKRRQNYIDLVERRRAIDHRLKTLENAIELLSEVGVGLAEPGEAADQVQVILANVEDAEGFVNEMRQVVEPMRVRGS